MWDGYVKYAYCIMFISLAGVTESMYETITNISSIQKLAKYTCEVRVLRKDDEQTEATLRTLSSDELVPGDVIVVPDNRLVPCDMILLTGSCIVNESMLTGESVPVIKNCLMPTADIYDPRNHDASKKYTLYGGTKVIQSREHGENRCLALVIRTGYLTTKGALVRDILYPRPTKFKFYQDSLTFVAAMALVGLLGFACTLPVLMDLGLGTAKLIDKSLDLITITVPPALPATMSVGAAFAI